MERKKYESPKADVLFTAEILTESQNVDGGNVKGGGEYVDDNFGNGNWV